jgi:uncharacterized protein (DUF169 family)
MIDCRAIEAKLMETVGGARRPVAIAFLDAPPAGVEKFEGSQPSSCSYWRLAAEGRKFYTEASDHLNCPVGAYTHNTLTPERLPELQQTLGLMSSIGYIRMEEVPGVFHLDRAPKVVAYAPLGETTYAPDAVLISGLPGAMMLIAEAAMRAGAMSNLPLLGRPTCMAIPAAMSNGAVTSSGCIGNRVYTDVPEDHIYTVLRGSDLEKVAAELDTIRSANRTLTEYHQERRRSLSTM